MKCLKLKSAAMAISLLLMISGTAIFATGCNKDTETDSTTEEETTEDTSEEETSDDLDEITDEDLEDIDDDDFLESFADSYTDEDGNIVYEYGDSFIVVELDPPAETTPVPVLDVVFDMDILNDYAEECDHKHWRVEELSSSDIGLDEKDFVEGFVAYDINDRGHYYIQYSDFDTAYQNVCDFFDTEDTISHIAYSNPAKYWIDFSTKDHMMDVVIEDNGFTIIDDQKIIVKSYDSSADDHPTNVTYDTPEINDLVDTYDEMGYALFNSATYDAFNDGLQSANEGFVAEGAFFNSKTDELLQSYLVYVLKYDNADEAIKALTAYFSSLSENNFVKQSDGSYTIDYQALHKFEGTITADGLVHLTETKDY